ncbi:transcription termination factor Rho [Saccharomonospora iraqiensis]|uniref:transcription termination factor Rho n=1 Tax=Saccharomonospora iraqiensis TaxID=52698 RepID=UPI00022E460C|nr:transcription termination factor Rho [Saccharomonospora iraqiensis]
MSNTDLLSGDVEPQSASGSGEQSSQSNGSATSPKRRPGGLSGMVIAELRALATELGIGDTTGMRKGDLIAAIRERQGKSKRGRNDEDDADSGHADTSGAGKGSAATDSGAGPSSAGKAENVGKAENAGKAEDSAGTAAATLPLDGMSDSPDAGARSGSESAAGGTETGSGGSPDGGSPDGEGRSSGTGRGDRRSGEGKSSGEGAQEDGGGSGRSGRRRRGSGRGGGSAGNAGSGDTSGSTRTDEESGRQKGDGSGDGSTGQRDGDQRRQNGNQGRQNNAGGQGGQGAQSGQGADDDERGGRRGRRYRDRKRRGRGEGGGGTDTDVREDDVLLPVAGILDVLENYAFVRTSGYLPGQNDVYVSMSLVRKHGLRRGDAITGVVRQPREGEQQRQKFNPLVRVDSVNGLDADVAKKRAEFHKLTPLYPNERLRLETTPNKMTTRVIDLVMPVGKGQRALIVSPPKAGKTTIMQDVANAITTNNPECHLMVVLVDERPEEVTDMQRSVNGEVIASTFDRPPSDHTSVAELSIERAKRLVEMGHDVVVLLDSITRLGRAYNLAAPASGRILSGGVDSTALFPPKRFLGAARNIEGGGSLTIFATAMVETGSTGDTVIFEEFKGTGNAELKLDRKIAERRVFPAVDVNPSGTRKEELLLSPDELGVTHKLHRVLHALDTQQAIDLLLDRLRKTKTNAEFLMQVSKTTPGAEED